MTVSPSRGDICTLPHKYIPLRQRCNNSGCICDTCDGVMGEGLYIGQVVVRTVFLKPLADVLLGPQHHWFGQTGQSRTGVVYSQGFTRTQLKHTQKVENLH